MTIYRVQKKAWYESIWTWAGLLGLLALIVIIGWLFWRTAAPAQTTTPSEAEQALEEAAQGLEVFLIEYPQAGEGVERRGAEAVLERATQAFERARPALDPAIAESIARDLAELQALVEAEAPADEVVPLAEHLRDRLMDAAMQKRP